MCCPLVHCLPPLRLGLLLTWNLSASLVWLAGESQGAFAFSLGSRGIDYKPPHLTLGPHACEAGALPTKLSSQPFLAWLPFLSFFPCLGEIPFCAFRAMALQRG